MYSFLRQHSTTICRLAVENFVLSKTENKAGLGLLALSGLFLFLALGFMLFGAHLYFVTAYGTDMAFIYTGSIFLALCLVFLLMAGGLAYYRYKKINSLKNEIIALTEGAIQGAEQGIQESVDEKPFEIVAVIATMGYFLGKRYL